MRRADRLFKIIQSIRRREVTTAARLARELEVSGRTIYRDIRDLALSGVPMASETGIGYAMARCFDLPPLMFTDDELTALVLGMRIVKSRADSELAEAAQDVLVKVEAMVPERLKSRISSATLFAPSLISSIGVRNHLGPLRKAIDEHRKVRLLYESAKGEETARIIRPLGIFFWSSVWTVGAWCQLRGAFRNFRIDRIAMLETLNEVFVDEPGRTLRDFLREQEAAFLR